MGIRSKLKSAVFFVDVKMKGYIMVNYVYRMVGKKTFKIEFNTLVCLSSNCIF